MSITFAVSVAHSDAGVDIAIGSVVLEGPKEDGFVESLIAIEDMLFVSSSYSFNEKLPGKLDRFCSLVWSLDAIVRHGGDQVKTRENGLKN